MTLLPDDEQAIAKLQQAAQDNGIDISGAKIRRTSSRFCLGVEHGDYNGTQLFGVGTNRFIWLAYRAGTTRRTRLFSINYPEESVVDFELGRIPQPRAPSISQRWARFAFGVDYILRDAGFALERGIEGVLFSNIVGGGMSRSASLCLNLILSMLDANGIEVTDTLQLASLAQAVENVYVGSPCGLLDQIMILFGREGMGTHYDPAQQKVDYVPLGEGAEDFRIVVLDTGTDRPGLEHSTYKLRRAQCEEFAELLGQSGFAVNCLADVRDEGLYRRILERFGSDRVEQCARLSYIYHAQQRFTKMLQAWRAGDVATVGALFREDGIGLRDEYAISGPELETMCDIARTVPGVLGERMLGGGDKGAAGAIVRTSAVDALKQTVAQAYPKSYPAYADKYSVYECQPVVEGVQVFPGCW